MKLTHIEADPDFRACMEACDRILTTKGHDYTQGDARLKNFDRNGERLGISPRLVLGIYLNKHLDAIETFLKLGQVESEPIEGRIQDAINYLLLLFKMVRRDRDRAASALMTEDEVRQFFDEKNPHESVLAAKDAA